MKHKPSFFGKSAFTLAELLVVVAIIGILVAVSIPVFTAQREKARRAVDMDHARQIKTALVLAFNNEEIEIPHKTDGHGYGAWVMLCNGSKEYAPEAYRKYVKGDIKGMWCGANAGVTVKGTTATYAWTYNKQVEQILKEAGLDVVAMRTYSNGDKNGWDWIIIEVGYDANGQFITRMYSGYKDKDGSTGSTGRSNLENLIYKNK